MLVFCGLFPGLLAGEVATRGAETGKWTMDYEAARKVAKEKKLPLFLNFTGSDWCGWCKLMDRHVFSQSEWQDYAKQNLVLVTLDFPRNKSLVPAQYVERNYHLQNQFGVEGYPTFIILDEDGETVLGRLGASRNPTPEQFIAEVENLIRFRDSELARKEATLSGADLVNYRATVKKLKATESDLQAWLDTNPQRTEENVQIYRNYLQKIEEMKQKLAQF